MRYRWENIIAFLSDTVLEHFNKVAIMVLSKYGLLLNGTLVFTYNPVQFKTYILSFVDVLYDCSATYT